MIAVALIAVAAGMVLVRFGWNRHSGVAWTGWGIVAAALAALTLREGAWGLAIGSVAGMPVALAALAVAGWYSPAKPRRARREAPSVTLPGRWPDAARRVAVFVLAGPVAFAAAQWLAFACQAPLRSADGTSPNATAAAFWLQPILWAGLMAIQLTRANTARMIAPPLIAGLAGLLIRTAG